MYKSTNRVLKYLIKMINEYSFKGLIGVGWSTVVYLVMCEKNRIIFGRHKTIELLLLPLKYIRKICNEYIQHPLEIISRFPLSGFTSLYVHIHIYDDVTVEHDIILNFFIYILYSDIWTFIPFIQ